MPYLDAPHHLFRANCISWQQNLLGQRLIFFLSVFAFRDNLALFRQEYTGPGGVEEVVEKPPNEEYSVAKWLKRNVPTKKTKCLNHNVEYFTASKVKIPSQEAFNSPEGSIFFFLIK